MLNYLLYKNVGNRFTEVDVCMWMLLYLDNYKQLDLISCKYEIVVTGSLYIDIFWIT